MNSSTRSRFLLVASISFIILSYIRCSSIENVNINVTTPCKDVSEAINRLYKALPDQMPIEARCKRYAVFLSMADTSGATHELALLQLSLLREELLDWLHGEINTADLATRYMTAIDAYLATRLEPAFIDLIECLRDIYTTAIKTYLDNPELKMVEELYRRVLASPAGEIDLESVDLSVLHPGSRTTLKELLEGYSDIPNENPGQIDLFNQLSSSYLPRKLLAEQFIRDTEERVRRICMKRKRLLSCQLHNRETDCNDESEGSPRQQRPPIERRILPETIEDSRLIRLEAAYCRKLDGQRRYRERNRERLRAMERDRQRRIRQHMIEQKNSNLRFHASQDPASMSESRLDQQPQERQQGLSEMPLSPADQSAPSLRSKSLDMAYYHRLEAQRRYRERNRERLRAMERDRQQRRRQQMIEQVDSVMQSHAGQLSVSESSQDQQRQGRQKGFLEALQPTADQLAPSLRPTPLSGQQVDTPDVRASERTLWLERLDKLEKARCRLRERERRYRAQNPEIVRQRERERKRRRRQRLLEQQQQQG